MMECQQFAALLLDEQGRKRTPVEVILGSSNRDRVLALIPAEAAFIAAGADAVVFQVSTDRVLRAGRYAERPAVPQVLQALKSFRISDGLMVEILPLVQMQGVEGPEITAVCELLAGNGFTLHDVKTDNFGRRADGSVCIIDPTLVQPDVHRHAAHEAESGSTHQGRIFSAWRGRVYLFEESTGKTVWYRPSAFAGVVPDLRAHVRITVDDVGRATFQSLLEPA